MAKTPPTPAANTNAATDDVINLRDQNVAAVLAWLIPGLGHWYQGRRSKAVLLFVCIMGTFVYGLYLGEGRVVYASFRSAGPGNDAEDKRLPFLCQIGVGGPSLPAIVQAYRFRDPNVRAAAEARIKAGQGRLWDWFMVPPSLEPRPDPAVPTAERIDWPDELDTLHKRLHRYFELGTVYTMVAGLLNVLAIFDAWGGPAYGVLSNEPPKKKEGGE